MSNEQLMTYTRADHKRFFNEAIKALRVLPAGTFGEGTTVEDNPAVRLLQELEKTQNETAEFSPELVVLPLTRKKFADYGLTPPKHISALMKRNDFFQVRIPVTLSPRPGTLFWRLLCVVELNPDAESPRPTALSVFPDEEWQTIIRAYQGMEIGLDENLEFKVELSQIEAKAGPLNGEARAKVGTKLAGGAGITIGKFDYHVQRPKILARGQNSPKIRWTLDGKEQFKEETPNLGMVLQVPKSVDRVDMAGALLAYRDFDTLMAEWKDVWERLKAKFLSRKTREFFDSGAPLPHHCPWLDITKGL